MPSRDKRQGQEKQPNISLEDLGDDRFRVYEEEDVMKMLTPASRRSESLAELLKFTHPPFSCSFKAS